MNNNHFYIGWDVGAWHCKKSSKSSDAIVILDGQLNLVGTPWRGNLREIINSTEDSKGWKTALFSHCKEELPADAKVTLAIDTPLGFSEEFVRLITRFQCSEPIETAATNPYLFRQTERYLLERGLTPLSAVTHMIGSQATKGMHVLARFAPRRTDCGVWSDGDTLTAIEAYPSACKQSKAIQQLLKRYQSLGHEDTDDALICALVGYLFETNRNALAGPPLDTPDIEGWIWVPKDGLLQRNAGRINTHA